MAVALALLSFVLFVGAVVLLPFALLVVIAGVAATVFLTLVVGAFETLRTRSAVADAWKRHSEGPRGTTTWDLVFSAFFSRGLSIFGRLVAATAGLQVLAIIVSIMLLDKPPPNLVLGVLAGTFVVELLAVVRRERPLQSATALYLVGGEAVLALAAQAATDSVLLSGVTAMLLVDCLVQFSFFGLEALRSTAPTTAGLAAP